MCDRGHHVDRPGLLPSPDIAVAKCGPKVFLIPGSYHAIMRDPASSTVLQFVSTFGVWLLSERLGLSPIITVVVYAMTLAQAAPGHLGARLRISSYSVWETAVFVVNVLASC